MHPFIFTGGGFKWLMSGVHGAIIEASVVVSITAGISDLLSQSGEMAANSIQNKKKLEEAEEGEELELAEQDWDWFRLGRILVIGSVYGPVEYGYFALLQYGMPWWQQVMLDNFVVTPCIYTCGIIMNMGMRDGNLSNFCKEWPVKFKEMFVVGLPLWLTMDTLTFTLVPLRHRVAFTRLGGFFFNIYCMHVLNGPRGSDDPGAAPLEKREPISETIELKEKLDEKTDDN